MLSQAFIAEIHHEAAATKRILERVPEGKFDWKPHEKSMNMGYLSLLVADIPRWIAETIEKGEIDLGHYEEFTLSTNAALLKYFDKNIESAKHALKQVSNEDLGNMFYLKNSGQLLYSSTKKESVQSSINHWVHHRGQLTVYMRLNNIAVPSIYGPSADERRF